MYNRRKHAQRLKEQLRKAQEFDFFKVNLKRQKEYLKAHNEPDDFSKRARFIQKANKDYQKLLDYNNAEYKKYINWSKEDWFPLGWMTDDPIIDDILDRYELLLPLLNFIYNRNRHLGDKYKKMVADTEAIYDKKHSKKNWDYSVFKTDKYFYKEACKKLKSIKKYIQRHVMALIKIGVIKKLVDRRRSGWILYADTINKFEYNHKDLQNLLPRQKMFVSEYLLDLNGQQAALRAGYSRSVSSNPSLPSSQKRKNKMRHRSRDGKKATARRN